MTWKGLTTLGILLAASLALILSTPTYGRPGFGDDCLSCHSEGGITLTSNVTDNVEVQTSRSFGVAIQAEGDTQELTITWSASADNPSFAFIPSTVVDNDPNDDDPAENSVEEIFKVTAPTAPGEYSIQVFAAGSGGKGAALPLQVNVISEGPSPENLPPRAYFLHTRRGMTLEFEDRSWDPDGSIVSWLWSFGDDASSTDPSPTHVYTESGTYTVTLAVTDNEGKSATQSRAFTFPSKNERFMLWTAQLVIGSLIIVFTSFFAVGIAAARFKRGGRNG